MSETTQEPLPDRRAPLAVWRAVQAFLTTLFHIFGAPEELAARHTLTLKQHQLILPWLRAAEVLMRRMLFIEAALIFVGPPASSRHTGNKRNSRQRKLLGFDAEHPEAWRVSFRCFSGPRTSSSALVNPQTQAPDIKQSAGGDARGPSGFRSAWPLAERMEALLRVFNNPELYIKRLASRLRKARAFVARFTESWREHRDLVGHCLHNALVAPITCAGTVLNSS